MYRRATAFTLVELLTVLAILLVLAGLLFPVFSWVKVSAKRSHCTTNMRNAHIASTLYMDDYDQFFMPVNHRPGQPGTKFDRTWVQLVLPYAKSFSIFNCPGDTTDREHGVPTIDAELVPGDIYSKYYAASMRVNMGYNYLYLAPVMMRNGQWHSEPKTLGMVTETSRTLLFVDSIWDRLEDGRPIGGGNWLVVPPCRYVVNTGPKIDSFNATGSVYTPYDSSGWKVGDPNSGHIYGNAWPWHNDRINVTRVDGSVRSISIKELSAGCRVQDGWRGLILDQTEYVWDTH